MNKYVHDLQAFAKGNFTYNRITDDQRALLIESMANIDDVWWAAACTCVAACDADAKRKLVTDDWREIDFHTENALTIMFGAHTQHRLDVRS